ncbi:hypothetical protein ABB30_11555 [Stenotrophomonas ginsengisoli]|uniref:Uncharacterized protein n=2 Tax=Stenotrophomonas ginsengisoli TaxID=336566 RepID=A0A0R0D2S4_9GAMM|nr:hypothetical protein ABB30_11555 [Stenotrophomonas ginsengisoli]
MTSDAVAAVDSAPVPVPRVDNVLSLISDVDGDGTLSYAIANGATINYWHGQQFVLQGKSYYTGFAWLSPAVFGEQEDEYPDPGQKAVLAQATFVLGSDAQQPWHWEGSELDIGQFGAHGQGSAVDSARQVQTWAMHNGDLLLAVPTRYDTPGATGRAVEILHFSATLPAQADDRRWRHLGTLEAGSDNSASCGEANPRIACRDVSAHLRFEQVSGQQFPLLWLDFAQASESSLRYRYEAPSRTYQPI